MSKIPGEILEKSIADIKKFAAGEKVVRNGEELQGKQRKFVETIDLQVTLKMYDPRKDKRFSGALRLPAIPRPNLKVCVLGDQKHCDQAKELGFPFMSVDDLKKLNKNKQQVRKLAKRYDAFVASTSLIKQIPRLLGPGLNRAGKFPTVVNPSDSLEDRVNEVKATARFQLKKVMCVARLSLRSFAHGGVWTRDDEGRGLTRPAHQLLVRRRRPRRHAVRRGQDQHPALAQLPHVAPQEELAEHRPLLHQEHHGALVPDLLLMSEPLRRDDHKARARRVW